MTDRELMELALEALVDAQLHNYALKHKETDDLITALRERLAQTQRTHWEGCEEVHPECRKQEAVAWMYVNMDGECEQIEYLENESMPDDPSITPLYTAPPRREWVGLTDDDLKPVCDEYRILFGGWVHDFTRAIEAKLKERNQ